MPALAQAPSLLPVGPFRIEPGESRVEFVMRDNRGGFTGTTDRVEGTVVVRQGDAEAFTASVDARVDARTIVTGNGMRDGQMRRDFLKTDQYPQITFRGTATVRGSPTATTVRALLHGALTIRDVTRDIDVPLDVTALAEDYRAAGEVVVKLSDFKIPIPRFLIFVAEDREKVVGFACVWLGNEVTASPSRYAYVSDLFVDAACRRRGVGQALLVQTARHARKNGVRHLYVQVLEKNVRARGAYRKFGFRMCERTYLKLL